MVYETTLIIVFCSISSHIFSNANEDHVAEVLHRLGLEDCFDDVICFEYLNPPNQKNDVDDTYNCCVTETGDLLPTSHIICKPLENSIQQAFKMANINPRKQQYTDCNSHGPQHCVGSSERKKSVDYALESIHNIREA
ncbi:HAD-like domain-containing protein, partial [Cynara cardunculus var. scolymus]